jgi:hypothetical protein
MARSRVVPRSPGESRKMPRSNADRTEKISNILTFISMYPKICHAIQIVGEMGFHRGKTPSVTAASDAYTAGFWSLMLSSSILYWAMSG